MTGPGAVAAGLAAAWRQATIDTLMGLSKLCGNPRLKTIYHERAIRASEMSDAEVRSAMITETRGRIAADPVGELARLLGDRLVVMVVQS